MKQRPASVTTALKLVLVGFLLGLHKATVMVGEVQNDYRLSGQGSGTLVSVQFLALLFIGNALLFLGLSERVNWVRKLYIVCSVISAPFIPFFIFGEFRSSIGWGIIHLVAWVLCYWAMVLLMKKPAREWFRAKEAKWQH